MPEPSIFIGSSSEALRIAGQVQYELQSVGRPKLWTQGVFGLGQATIESLTQELSKCDFAVLVLSPDDRTTSRDVEHNSPRDNVIFELGLFMGQLGRERTFVLYDKMANLRLLSDLAGVTVAPYNGQWANDDLAPAIGAACHPIREAILKLGPSGDTRLLAASNTITEASSKVSRLIHLLARSRKVELEVFLSQFGRMIDKETVERMMADLSDLDKETRSG